MPEVHSHASLSLPLTLALVLVALAYLCGWLRYRTARPDSFPVWRVVAFLGGVFTVWVAVGSPLVALDHQLLTFHMVKHLLLMTVAAPLILMGTPGRRARWSGRSLSLFWLAGTATVIGWHIPAAFQLALGSHGWHAVENSTFMVAGLLFWWPVVQPWPGNATYQGWAAPVYLFLATMPCDILSAFLVFCGRVVYPAYLCSPGHFHLSALEDQELAGALMWVSVTFIYLVPAVAMTVRILSPRVQGFETRVSV
jgi:cytochrome c oxidase assembly factor CtaG